MRVLRDEPGQGTRVAPDYFSLGATLYIPASRPDLPALLNLRKLTNLRSLVVCTEDALLPHEVPAALTNIERSLDQLLPLPVLRFLRPRNLEVLYRLLRMPGIGNLDGLVLPKITCQNILPYAEAAARVPHLHLMPTLETEDAFARSRLEALRQTFDQVSNPVLCVRIGGNDLLHLLGVRRPRHLTAYDTPLRSVINDIILTFRPAGYNISAPVFEHLDHPGTLAREVELDLAHGLWSKTAIHPTQIPVIERAYRVCPQEYAMASRVLAPDAPAVFRYAGQMCEIATHKAWAKRLLLRAALFGIA
jgi:citrate lyase beta subunit